MNNASPATQRAIDSPGTVPELPGYLAQWAQFLGWLEPDLCKDVALLSNRLEQVLTGFFVKTQSGADEPDGYAGISQRGPLERLLLSEWLLADEIPEEFLRRASMNELFYLEPNRTSPHILQKVYLLLDGSPTQWGAPRLLHLAVLVVLTRYAAQRGAQLHWGFLHHPQQNWHTGLSTREVRSWQSGHFDSQVNAQHCQAWYKKLSELMCLPTQANQPPQRATHEIWVLGGKGLGDLLKENWPDINVRFMTCEVPLEEEHVNELALQLQFSNRQLNMYLPLPPMAVQTQLLRNPFRSNATAANALTSQQGLQNALWQSVVQFDEYGRYACVRYPLDCLQTCNYHNEYPAYPKISKVSAALQNVIGAQIGSKGKCTLSLQVTRDNRLMLHINGVKASILSEVELIDRLPAYADRKNAWLVVQKKGWHQCFAIGADIFIVDALRTLWKIRMGQLPFSICKNVCDVHLISHKKTILILYIDGPAIRWEEITFKADGTSQRIEIKPFSKFHNPTQDPLPDNMRVQAGYNHEGVAQGIAWKCRGGKWGVQTQDEFFYVGVEKKSTVLGLHLSPFEHKGLAGLLTLNRNKNALFLHRQNEWSNVRQFDSQVLAIAYHFVTGRLVYIGVDGYFCIESLDGKTSYVRIPVSEQGIDAGQNFRRNALQQLNATVQMLAAEKGGQEES